MINVIGANKLIYWSIIEDVEHIIQELSLLFDEN